MKESESLNMELHLKDKLVESKGLEILELQKQAVKDRRTILMYTIKNLDFQELEMNQKIADVKRDIENNSEKRKKYIESIKKRLRITKRFGFNPDTLEIIEE